MTIHLYGRTLATAIIARCLAEKSTEYTIGIAAEATAPSPQVVCINDVALSLLRDLFPDLLSADPPLGLPLVARDVLWGDEPRPQRIRQDALVVETGLLKERIFATLPERAELAPSDALAMDVNPVDDRGNWMSVGDRSMLTTHVSLRAPLKPARSLVESLLDGWMFLMPLDDTNGILQAMVAVHPTDPDARLQGMLAQSSLIAPHILDIKRSQVIPAFPCVRLPLVEEGRIFVGGQAVRLDPVSGEGVPFAIRSAILAAAVLMHEGPQSAVLSHYTNRTLTSFLNHLSGCHSFYEDVLGVDPAWRMELRKTELALAELSSAVRLMEVDDLDIRLEGFRLIIS